MDDCHRPIRHRQYATNEKKGNEKTRRSLRLNNSYGFFSVSTRVFMKSASCGDVQRNISVNGKTCRGMRSRCWSFPGRKSPQDPLSSDEIGIFQTRAIFLRVNNLNIFRICSGKGGRPPP